MRILLINKFLYPNGGSETYLFEVGRQLERMGHEVQYFGMEHEGRIVGNHVQSYTSDMDFHTGGIKKLLYSFRIIYSREARKKLRVVLDDFAPQVVHLNNFNFQLTPSILYEIRKYERITANKIKIVYTAHDSQLVCPNHLMQQFYSGEPCTACVTGSPWSCTKYNCIHGSKAKSILGSLEAAIYRKLKTYRMIDTVICPSSFLKEKLDHLEELKDKTIVLHNFVNQSTSSVVSKDKNSYVFYMGRYSREKGIETLLEVCRDCSDIPFRFAGNGPMEEEVDAVANITNYHFQTGEALQELIQNAAFLVFPSECNENCPFSVMEAMVNGVPVIASNIGGVPELISQGENGLLFEAGNREQLKQKIQGLWKDKEYLAILKDHCKETKFDDIFGYCEKLISYYLS